ncbi:hypothetical protein GCM10011578_053040 [Streptomyces fuscichromogenes]|uniref:Uncharacterized protein n=2 Tax=Streptomyces fuscichromogenes TaxID=1324013 RepID=A0A917XH55_9ACTN|nr:hypothetical protein GCM10011578_053040 [Streptomyces fuscichromogenes]
MIMSRFRSARSVSRFSLAAVALLALLTLQPGTGETGHPARTPDAVAAAPSADFPPCC